MTLYINRVNKSAAIMIKKGTKPLRASDIKPSRHEPGGQKVRSP